MSLSLATLTKSITAISIPGIKILDMDEVGDAIDTRLCPVLYPDPVNLVSNMFAEMAAFGTGVGSRWNVEYDLTYTLLYSPIGSGRGLLDNISDTFTAAMTIIDAILINTVLSGAVTVKFNGILAPGPMVDPGGNQFFGVQIILHVLEFPNG